MRFFTGLTQRELISVHKYERTYAKWICQVEPESKVEWAASSTPPSLPLKYAAAPSLRSMVWASVNLTDTFSSFKRRGPSQTSHSTPSSFFNSLDILSFFLGYFSNELKQLIYVVKRLSFTCAVSQSQMSQRTMKQEVWRWASRCNCYVAKPC